MGMPAMVRFALGRYAEADSHGRVGAKNARRAIVNDDGVLALWVVLHVTLKRAAAQCRGCVGGLLQRTVGLRR
jgi:hypothetical protein